MSNKSNTTIYVISSVDAQNNPGLESHDKSWYPLQQKDLALVEYGKQLSKYGDRFVIRMVEIELPWDVDDFEDMVVIQGIEEYINQGEGRKKSEIELTALFNHIPEKIDHIEAVPIECRTDELIARIQDNKDDKLYEIAQGYVGDKAADLVKLFKIIQELNDNDFGDPLQDGVPEYIRGQVEFVSRLEYIHNDSYIIHDALFDMMDVFAQYEQPEYEFNF